MRVLHGCPFCDVVMWYAKWVDFFKEALNPTFLMCCQKGIVRLPSFRRTLDYLDSLLDYKGGIDLQDLEKILKYTIQCFSSIL